MTQDVEPVDDGAVGPVDDGTVVRPADDDAPPTLLARARALWCQLVSGLG